MSSRSEEAEASFFNAPGRVATKTPRQVAIRALPLGIGVGLVSLTTAFPRYALEHVWGEMEVGQFAVVAALAQISVVLMVAMM